VSIWKATARELVMSNRTVRLPLLKLPMAWLIVNFVLFVSTFLVPFQIAGAETVSRLDRLLGPFVVSNGLGVNVHFVEGHQADLIRIKGLGFSLIRTDLFWATVESSPGEYDWRGYDQLVQQSRASGLTPILILDYSNPNYAPASTVSNRPENVGAPPINEPAQAAFMRFARAAADRYSGQVIWEIWNEPNLNFNKPFDADAYVSFAIRVCRSVREVDPSAPVIAPASNGFVFSLYHSLMLADSDGCLDGLSVHPYRYDPPESALPDWARLASAIKRANPATRSPYLIDSEWGYSSFGAPWTRERQADYDLRVYLTDILAGVRITIVYDYQDDGADRLDKESNFGLFAFDGQPKPVARAFSDLVRELRGLHLLGRVSAGPDDFIVAFGLGDSPTKLVGWTKVDGGHDITVAPQLCLSPFASALGCPADRLLEIEGTRMNLSSRPIVETVRSVRR
jgi:hypothetical protein